MSVKTEQRGGARGGEGPASFGWAAAPKRLGDQDFSGNGMLPEGQHTRREAQPAKPQERLCRQADRTQESLPLRSKASARAMRFRSRTTAAIAVQISMTASMVSAIPL